MSAILTFLTIIQKILLILSILIFIPTSIFIFAPKSHTFTPAQLKLYEHAHSQVFTTYLQKLRVNVACTVKEMILNEDYCFQRVGKDMYGVGYAGSRVCQGYGYQFEGFVFCYSLNASQNNIINYYNTSTKTFVYNESSYPIFQIQPSQPPQINPTPVIKYYHHLPSQSCTNLANMLTLQPQQKYSLSYHKAYQDSSRLLWFYTLPILSLTLILIIINQTTNKYNLRKYILMGCVCLNISLITLIIKGIVYFADVKEFKRWIAQFAWCFVKEESENLLEMSKFESVVGQVFVFFMGIFGLLIILVMAGQLIGKLLQMKYYTIREGTIQEEQGMQLSNLKTSLRSRRIKQANTINSSIRIGTFNSMNFNQ